MSIINATPLLAAAGGDYQISRSVRLRSSASAYFNRTPASAGNRQKFTISAWVKRGKLATSSPIMGAGASGATEDRFMFAGNDTFLFDGYSSGSTVFYMNTTAVYRDPSAWYHFVCEVDTTQATSSNRIKIYVNGVQVTAFATATYPSQNANLNFNNSVAQYIGYTPDPYYADQYFTEINFIDGQALTPSSFGETDSITGVWKPKKYAGTYGTNGFYLNFSDNSSNTATTIGKDYSGNGNNWTPNNISVTAGVTYDSMLDVPTLYADGGNGRGNYAVLNPLSSNSYSNLLDGGLTYVSSISLLGGPNATIGVQTGKWYWEVTAGAVGDFGIIGLRREGAATTSYPGSDANSYGYYGSNGNKYTNASASAYGSTFGNNDVIGVAFDADAGTLTFYKNNVSQGVAFTSIPSATWFPALGDGSTVLASTYLYANFGQRPFAYTPPTGFKALNTQNLPEPTIKKGNQYFDVSLWTGNGTSQSIVNSGAMQPDLVWAKSRSNAYNNSLIDSSRGVSKALFSDLTNAEDNAPGYYVTAFNSNGFSVGLGTGANGNGSTYVGWQWKESPSAGFDIVTYTGTGGVQTVNHSLGVAPKMILVKSRSDGSGIAHWTVYHAGMDSVTPQSYAMHLNLTNARNASSIYWNSTAPTSTTFTLGGGSAGLDINNSGQTFVAYLFAEVSGFSKFGSYTGNGSADGPFVFTGFRPKFVMIKRTDGTGIWLMHDTSRGTSNVVTPTIEAQTANAEFSFAATDILSNGFKIRLDGANTAVNASGGTYIFMAFAESPFKTSLAR